MFACALALVPAAVLASANETPPPAPPEVTPSPLRAGTETAPPPPEATPSPRPAKAETPPTAATAPTAPDSDRAILIQEMSLEELMLLPVVVAAPSRPRAAHRCPGIVDVVTREEILASGARDLIDVLLRVPGIQFGVDVQGVVGIGVNGLWGHEGKVLLLVDGITMNEFDYSTTQFGNRLPLDQVERIEIIRGPGSVIHGGFAELAVINVVTRSPEEVRGASASVSYGRMAGTLARSNVGLSAASPVDGVPGLEFGAGLFLGKGNRSDRSYRDLSGRSYSLAGQSALDPRYLNAVLKYRGLSVRFIMDHYRMTQRDGFGDVLAKADEQTFPAYHVEAKYDWQVHPNVTLLPRFAFMHQVPWRILDKSSPAFSNRYEQKYAGGLRVSWDPLDSLNLLAGVEGYLIRAALIDDELVGLHRPYGNGRTSVSYWDVATLAQLAWENPIVDATAGGRFEYHSAAGWSIVPRAALTKEVDWFHAKAMFSMAFRNPGTMNLALSPGLSPERTRVFEVELGAKIGRHLLFAVTGYDITIDDAIVFQPSTKPDGTLVETYRNIGRTGTCGLTSELRLRHPRVWANLGYSFYTAAGRNGGSPYEVPGREDVLLGFAPHKLTLNGSAKLTEHFVVSPSLVFLHERAGYTGLDADGNRAATLLDPVVLLDLFIEYRDAGLKGLDLGFGVYNLLDHDAPYVQPYDGGHAPLPGPSREFMGRVTWSYRFD